jgi:hypothetical protein
MRTVIGAYEADSHGGAPAVLLRSKRERAWRSTPWGRQLAARGPRVTATLAHLRRLTVSISRTQHPSSEPLLSKVNDSVKLLLTRRTPTSNILSKSIPVAVRPHQRSQPKSRYRARLPRCATSTQPSGSQYSKFASRLDDSTSQRKNQAL